MTTGVEGGTDMDTNTDLDTNEESTAGPGGLEIAVIGMAGAFPGAPDLDRFWHNLRSGQRSISTFPLPEADGDGGDAGDGAGELVPAAGVLDGVELFDAAFFGYSPRDAEILDPQHRVFLECASAALEDAGHVGGGGSGAIGVYAGSSLSTYLLRHLLPNRALVGRVGQYDLVLANDKDMLATRVAYHLDLEGPAVTVQSACSTSLVAVHQACQALLARECDLAIAGGVSVRLPQQGGHRYQEGGILSADGHCRPFDEQAGGTVGGNGVGAVVLKPLADALRDGDHIRAVIKGTAINNDGGRKVGFVAPSSHGQAAVIRTAHEVAEVDPATIGYVETHGTATAMGDPIEFEALNEAFTAGGGGPVPGHCALGAVKAQIGHLDAAAGIAGLIKTVLALEHATLPPSPYFRAPNPAIALAGSPFALFTEERPWPRLGAPRRAGVSSFGMGGTNAHIVLEEAPDLGAETGTSGGGSTHPQQLLLLSARTGTALADARLRLRERLRREPDLDLADVAHTLQQGRRTFDHRLALVSPDREQALALLAPDAPGVLTSRQNAQRREAVFMFSGQGAQYPAMGGELYRAEPAYRAAFDACAEILLTRTGTDLRTLVMPPDGADPRAAADLLRRTEHAQPALFAVEYALSRLWAQWGVRPRAMVGHSVGEYVAAHLAGVLDLADALTLVAARGRLMQSLPEGAMLSVGLPADKLRTQLPPGVAVAASNGPTLSVASGPGEQIQALERELARAGVAVRRLHTSHAFHSPMMDPVLDEFTGLVAQVRLSPPRLPYVSNLTGRWITDAEAVSPRYWAQQLSSRVRFTEALDEISADGPAVLLEVGPGDTLATLARQRPAAEGHTTCSSLPRPGAPDTPSAHITASLGRLWLAGVSPDWPGYRGHEQRRRVPLPGYPFERKRYWIEPPADRPGDDLGTAPQELPEQPGEPEPQEHPSAEPRPQGETADHPRPDLATPFVAPRTPGESAVAEVWSELLGIGGIGVHDNFFELGGHSLLATQVSVRLRDALHADLPAGAVMQAPTVAELAARVAESTPPPGGAPDTDDELLAQLLAELDGADDEQIRAALEEGADR